MDAPLELDCRGMKCPRPIIEIAKLARRSPPGTRVRMVADDLAFESDIRAWCENAHAALLSLGREGDASVALVQLADGGRSHDRGR